MRRRWAVWMFCGILTGPKPHRSRARNMGRPARVRRYDTPRNYSGNAPEIGARAPEAILAFMARQPDRLPSPTRVKAR